VGDLLQTVYATAALLGERLPAAAALERNVLADLRGRAERTRRLLDTVHDLIRPPTLNPATVDLAELAASLAATTSREHPRAEVRTRIVATPALQGDPKRLTQMGELILKYACEMARGPVVVAMTTSAASNEVEWTVSAESGAIPEEHLAGVAEPFAKPDPGGGRLRLALASRLAELHGGRFTATNLSTGGFEVRVVLPVG
jgi:signal transduction histidine kinase